MPSLNSVTRMLMIRLSFKVHCLVIVQHFGVMGYALKNVYRDCTAYMYLHVYTYMLQVYFHDLRENNLTLLIGR